jgi:hypothetical protein
MEASFIFSDHDFRTVLLTMGIGLVMILLFWNLGKLSHILFSFRNRRKNRHRQDLSEVSDCKNPNCVRCQRYRQVQQRAQQRLAWIMQSKVWKASGENGGGDATATAAVLSDELSQSRIPSAVRRQRSNNTRISSPPPSWQNPTVLMVADLLPSQEIVTSFHQAACRYLLKHSARQRIWRALQENDHDDNSNTNYRGPSTTLPKAIGKSCIC